MVDNTRKRLELGFAGFMLAFFMVYFIVTLSYPPRPAELPRLVSGVGAALCVTQLISALRKSDHKSVKVNWRKVGYTFAAMALFLVSSWLLGIVISAGLFVALLGWGLGARNKLSLALVGGGTALAIYLIFVRVLMLTLNRGILTGF